MGDDKTVEWFRGEMSALFGAGVAAVDAFDSVLRSVSVDSRGVMKLRGRVDAGSVGAIDLRAVENVYVVGCGKASVPMAAAVERLVGSRITAGVVTTKYGHSFAGQVPKRIAIIEADHPVPDENGMRGARAALELLTRAGERDLVVAVLSGGGSALWTAPAPGLTIEDLQDATQTLLRCGADIGEINLIRKRLSSIKGGKALHAAWPARVVAFVISDVIGDDLSAIASGPFAEDGSDAGAAQRVVAKYSIQSELPPRVVEILCSAAAGSGTRGEPIDPSPAMHCMCGSNRIAVRAVAEEAVARGFEAAVIDNPVAGEVLQAAEEYCETIIRIARERSGRPLCIVSGGETTVRLPKAGVGSGGRNQEFALVCAVRLSSRRDVGVLSCGTDGTDGPTDAAGALVTGETVARAVGVGLDPDQALARHDSYGFFGRLGDLIKTGPTGTNVMDLQIALIV